MPTIRVTAAVIRRQDSILIARRGPSQSLAGYWEFPGGKLEKDETPETCLAREILEELSMKITVGEFIASNVHSYGEVQIELLAYWAEALDDDFQLAEHSEAKWISPTELFDYELAPADIPIAAKIQRPTSDI